MIDVLKCHYYKKYETKKIKIYFDSTSPQRKEIFINYYQIVLIVSDRNGNRPTFRSNWSRRNTGSI